MVSLKERATEKKRGGKGAVYVTEPQSCAHFSIGKGIRQDPKITQYDNGQIILRKHDKLAYGVIIMYFMCTLQSANKLISAVSATLPNQCQSD